MSAGLILRRQLRYRRVTVLRHNVSNRKAQTPSQKGSCPVKPALQPELLCPVHLLYELTSLLWDPFAWLKPVTWPFVVMCAGSQRRSNAVPDRFPSCCRVCPLKLRASAIAIAGITTSRDGG